MSDEELEELSKFELTDEMRAEADLRCEELEYVPTSTTWTEGHVPWNAGKSGVQDLTNLQKGRAKYQEEWHKHNVKKIYVGHWSPPVNHVATLNKKLLTCPHCGKESNAGNAKRWHFDNCGKKREWKRSVDGKFAR